MSPSTSHLILIPSYNSGRQVLEVARTAASYWKPVWVLIDGSTDGSLATLQSAAIEGVKIWTLDKNRGKGAAVLYGMQQAYRRGFTHALVMDADGQHSPQYILPFMEESASFPKAMVLGQPQFGPDAPLERVYGRRIGNWLAALETPGQGVGDSLFGFRVYPLAPAIHLLQSLRTARGFDFDTELVVRLYWAGVSPRKLGCPVYYPPKKQGGISHFRYLRDNLLLAGTHVRLLWGLLQRLPLLSHFKAKR